MKTPRPFRSLVLTVIALVTIAWQTTALAGVTHLPSPPLARRLPPPSAPRMSPAATAALVVLCLPFIVAGTAFYIGTAPLWIPVMIASAALEPKRTTVVRQTSIARRTIPMERRKSLASHDESRRDIPK